MCMGKKISGAMKPFIQTTEMKEKVLLRKE